MGMRAAHLGTSARRSAACSPSRAATLEAAHGVPAEVVAASVVDQALIDVRSRAGVGEARRRAGAPGAGRTEAQSLP